MDTYILAIDAGTTSSRAIVFDENGQQISMAQFEFPQLFPQKSWVEHNPITIWETQHKAIEKALANANLSATSISAIGITNQRETTVVWNRTTGQPVYNAIVWQDRRTAAHCDKLEQNGYGPMIYEKTGLLLDAYFSATKIQWILDQDPKIRQAAEAGELAFGTIDSWLIWNLTKGKHHVTDATNASRTLLFDIHNQQWDTELLDLFKIPRGLLPAVVDSAQHIGTTDAGVLGAEIPISGIAGDQQAALFGQLCTEVGDVKNTYGTGCFCIMNTGEKAVQSNNRLLTTVGYRIHGKTTYALEGSVFIAGALVQWLRDQLGMIQTAAEIEELAKSVTDNGGVCFIPALSGLAAPYWDSHATGSLLGITRDTNKGHIGRAALEAIALRTYEVIIAMEKDAGHSFKALKVDGGASTNNLLMQIQSDLLNKEVIRPKTTETTALGAAFLAGVGIGLWKDETALKDLWQKDHVFTPQSPNQAHEILDLWRKNMSKILNT